MDRGRGNKGGNRGRGRGGGKWANKSTNVAETSTPKSRENRQQGMDPEEMAKLVKSTVFTEIDGCEGEGGGQVVRNSISLSALLGKPVHITGVRGKREKPGLQKQHLTGLNLVTRLCDAACDGARVGSGEILFIPKEIQSKTQYEADTQTAGSILLLIQISLPVLLFSPHPISVTYKGGTNAMNAPMYDYFERVFCPIVSLFGVKLDMTLERRGFYPKGLGIVKLTANPVQHLNPITMADPGHVTEVEIHAFHAGFFTKEDCDEIVKHAEEILHPGLPTDVKYTTKIVAETRQTAWGDGIGVTILAKTSTGCILAGSALNDKGKTIKEIGSFAAKELVENVNYGGCFDEYLADQVIIFMALANGTSRIRTGPLSLHTTTSIHFSGLMTGAKFTVTPVKEGDNTANYVECVGINYQNKNLATAEKPL